MELESVGFFLLSPFSPFSYWKSLLKLLVNLILLLLLFNFSIDLNTFLICGIQLTFLMSLSQTLEDLLGLYSSGFFPIVLYIFMHNLCLNLY